MGWNPGRIEDPDVNYLTEKIRATRQEQEVMTKTAAERVGMDPKYWTNLEHRRFIPNVRTLARMAEAIGCRLDIVPAAVPRVDTVPLERPERVARVSKAGPTLLRIMDRVRAARERAGLTQEQAAARVGVVKATWGHLERGHVSHVDVGIERIATAARAVGLTVDVVAEHQVPLLEMERAEVDEVRALIRWYRDRAPKMTDTLSSALEKLEKLEETA